MLALLWLHHGLASHLLSFRKGCSTVPKAKGDMKERIETPFLSNKITLTGLYHGCHLDSSGSFH